MFLDVQPPQEVENKVEPNMQGQRPRCARIKPGHGQLGSDGLARLGPKIMVRLGWHVRSVLGQEIEPERWAKHGRKKGEI
jgi:hypothetical protein